MPYRSVYKCKLCGLRIISDSTIPDHIADKINSATTRSGDTITVLFDSGRPEYGLEWKTEIPHRCPNEDIGVATFIGLAKDDWI